MQLNVVLKKAYAWIELNRIDCARWCLLCVGFVRLFYWLYLLSIFKHMTINYTPNKWVVMGNTYSNKNRKKYTLRRHNTVWLCILNHRWCLVCVRVCFLAGILTLCVFILFFFRHPQITSLISSWVQDFYCRGHRSFVTRTHTK